MQNIKVVPIINAMIPFDTTDQIRAFGTVAELSSTSSAGLLVRNRSHRSRLDSTYTYGQSSHTQRKS